MPKWRVAGRINESGRTMNMFNGHSSPTEFLQLFPLGSLFAGFHSWFASLSMSEYVVLDRISILRTTLTGP